MPMTIELLTTLIDFVLPIVPIYWNRFSKVLDFKLIKYTHMKESTQKTSSLSSTSSSEQPNLIRKNSKINRIKGLKEELEKVLKSSILTEALATFLSTEFCVENLLFLLSIRTYRTNISSALKTGDKLFAINAAKQLSSQYIINGSINEVKQWNDDKTNVFKVEHSF